MAFDGMMTFAITEELKEALQSGKINKIYQPSDREIHLHIRAQGKNQKLLLSANPTYPRIHLSSQQLDNPAHAPMFCMVLRKHLEGGIIERIEQVGKERIIHLDIRSRNELGDIQLKRLVLEIMGRHSNLILIDPQKQMIIDSIHYVSPGMSQYRTVLPGREYISPPDQRKLDPFEIDQQTIIKKVDFNQGKLDQQMVQQFIGISPLLAKEILYRAGLPNRENVCSSFLNMIKLIRSREFNPCVITSQNKEYFYLFPLDHLQGEQVFYPSVSQMLEAFFHGKAERDQVKQRAVDLLKFLTNEKEKNEKKIIKLYKTEAENKQADTYKLYGELLTVYMHQIKPGASHAEVVNYYDEDGETISIPLQPQLTVNENAQHYYKKYTKAKNSLAIIEEQINLAKQEIAYFETLLQQLEQISPKDIQEIREELVEGHYIKDRSSSKKGKKKETKPEPETFYASDGTEILVGKNNKQNDYVTNRIASPHDTWLHTKDIPGSHVLIRSKNVSEETLVEAAQLAAYFSKARHSSQVPVDYTLIKYVKKPSGAKPGYVTYDQQKTLYVTPDERVAEKLGKK